MDPILNLGITIILFLQSLGTWLLAPMKLFTLLGNEEFYLFVAPAIFWCWDASLGIRLGLALMVSGALNSILKLVFHGPRPYWYDTRVHAYSTETSFGVPSGHSQNAVVVWGFLAARLRRNWTWLVAIVIMFLIGLSRMYLGVHFPHDVLLGWLIGALLLWAFIAWEGRLVDWLNKKKPSEQVLTVFGFSLGIILLGALARLAIASWTLPTSWMQNALYAAPDAEPIAPLALSGLISNAGAFFGMAAGYILLLARGGFNAGGPAWQRLVRFLIGLVGVFLLWFGLGLIFPDGETLLPFLLRYIRYTLVGCWISGLAPLLFIRLRLAKAR